MKKFVAPELDVLTFTLENVLTESGNQPGKDIDLPGMEI